MAKKDDQLRINEVCEETWKRAMEEYNNPLNNISVKKLRYCSAKVYETDNFYILVSYFTPIAVLDKLDNHVYDMLRCVYGYTSTSAQHIAKFAHDYADPNYYSFRFTWRYIKK